MLWALLAIAIGFAALVILVDLAGARSGVLGALSEPRPQAAFIAVFALVATPLLRNDPAMIAAAVVAVVAMLPVAQYRLAKFEPVIRGESALKVLVWNTGGELDFADRWGRKISDAAIDRLAALNVDVILLQEAIDQDVARFTAKYPAYRAMAEDRRGDEAPRILLRADRADDAEIETGPWGAVLRLGGADEGAFSLIATHAPGPASSVRGAFFDALAEKANAEQAAGRRVAIAGDINAGPFGPAFRRLLKDAKLRDPARGRRPMATWPVPIFGVGLQIDHIIVSEGVAAVDHQPGPWLRSDHTPIYADLRW